MKVGDKVKVIGIAAGDVDTKAISYIGDSGIIESTDNFGSYPIKIRFDKDHSTYRFNIEELELVKPIVKEIITSKEDFYILLDTHVKPFELEALFDWARIHGYSFHKHTGLELHQAGKGSYVFINFHHVHGGDTIYREKRDSFSVDNNSQGIKLSYKIEDIINKKEENMNEEIEKALKEGDMSMALFNNNVTNLGPPNQSEVKSSLGGLKKRTKKVKFVTRLI